MRHVAFDLETTGLDWLEGHRIVEIGAVEIIDGKLTGKEFHCYVNPQRDVPKEAENVHKLNYEFLKDFPVFSSKEIIEPLRDFFEESYLVAHNGMRFDLPFLNYELKKAKSPPLYNPLIDTLVMARYKYPGSPGSLDSLSSRFDLSLAERKTDGHGALLDSRLLARIFIGMCRTRQQGFDLTIPKEKNKSKNKIIRKRENPLPSFLTQDEKNAHEIFIREQLTDSMWIY
jgi:DNA polymerase III subunit epsilon